MANVSCNELMVNPGSPYYYSQSWKHCGVEDFVDWLRTDGTGYIESVIVTDTDQYVYESDFFGYLTDVHKITAPYMWDITLRLNHMRRPDEFGEGVIAIALIKADFVTKLMAKIMSYRNAIA